MSSDGIARRTGLLRPGDSWTMAVHFKGFLDQDLFEHKIMAPSAEISAEAIERAAADAAETFLRAYRA